MDENKTEVVAEEFKRRLMERMAADGVQFRVCANCGVTYPVDPDDNETVCSDRCSDEFIRHPGVRDL